MTSYVPERGDLVWINMNPQAGHEQAGRRPAVILSPKMYNEKVRLALCCPVTNQIKGYPFEVALPDGSNVSGVVLSDQVKSMDWKSRNATFIEKLPVDVSTEILEKIAALLRS